MGLTPPGVLCTACNLWIHSRCEGLTRAQVNVLSRSGGNLGFICCVCKENQSAVSNIDSASAILGERLELPQQLEVSAAPDGDSVLLEGEQSVSSTFPFNETTLPESEESFQFQEEHLQNVSLEDETQFFKKKGLHFVHLNCKSLLSKIDEIREFVLHNKPHVICFSETKLDSTVTGSEVLIDGYSSIRRDRNRHNFLMILKIFLLTSFYRKQHQSYLEMSIALHQR